MFGSSQCIFLFLSPLSALIDSLQCFFSSLHFIPRFQPHSYFCNPFFSLHLISLFQPHSYFCNPHFHPLPCFIMHASNIFFSSSCFRSFLLLLGVSNVSQTFIYLHTFSFFNLIYINVNYGTLQYFLSIFKQT